MIKNKSYWRSVAIKTNASRGIETIDLGKPKSEVYGLFWKFVDKANNLISDIKSAKAQQKLVEVERLRWKFESMIESAEKWTDRVDRPWAGTAEYQAAYFYRDLKFDRI